MKQKKILFFIIFSQFACTSVWFAVNAVMPELTQAYNITASNSLGFFTAVIQFGFIIGTLIFAFLSIADRYSASKIFMICALISALSNFSLLHQQNSYWSIAILRFITGACLAGIYPIGIKIASDYFENGLGKALGFLVGTLVLGTAIPHFFSYVALKNNLFFVVTLTSGLSLLGALLVGFGVPKGPYSKLGGSEFKPKIIISLFSNQKLRKASLGYFGHMWELYTFWAIVPILLKTYNKAAGYNFDISLWTFIIIVSGFFSCIVGGYISELKSSLFVAKFSLVGSLCCILIFPIMITLITSPVVFMVYMIIWGMLVIADSPQLSTLVAQSATANYKGTSITLVNCIGFLITIFSIQIITNYTDNLSSFIPFIILAFGPLLGIYFLSFTKT